AEVETPEKARLKAELQAPELQAPELQCKDREVRLTAADGKLIEASLCLPDKGPAGAVVLVPASNHERHAYGDESIPGLPQSLRNKGIAVLRIDIRGRGASLGDRAFHSMAPGEREAVRLDVEAAVDFMARLQKFGVGGVGWGMAGAFEYVAR